MINALLDENDVNTALAVLNTDTIQGQHLVRIKLNESNEGMLVTTTATISFTMKPVSPSDENYRHVMTWEGTDGLPYPWVADSTGAVLIDE